MKISTDQALSELACTSLVLIVTPTQSYSDSEVLNELIKACRLKQAFSQDPELQNAETYTQHGFKSLDDLVGYSFLGLPPGMVLQKATILTVPNLQTAGTYYAGISAFSDTPRFSGQNFSDVATGGPNEDPETDPKEHNMRDFLEEGLVSSGDRQLTYYMTMKTTDQQSKRAEPLAFALGGAFRDVPTTNTYAAGNDEIDPKYVGSIRYQSLRAFLTDTYVTAEDTLSTDCYTPLSGVRSVFATCPSLSGATMHMVKKDSYVVDQLRGCPQLQFNLDGDVHIKKKLATTCTLYFIGRTHNPLSTVYKPSINRWTGRPSGVFIGDLNMRPLSSGTNRI